MSLIFAELTEQEVKDRRERRVEIPVDKGPKAILTLEKLAKIVGPKGIRKDYLEALGRWGELKLSYKKFKAVIYDEKMKIFKLAVLDYSAYNFSEPLERTHAHSNLVGLDSIQFSPRDHTFEKNGILHLTTPVGGHYAQNLHSAENIASHLLRSDLVKQDGIALINYIRTCTCTADLAYTFFKRDKVKKYL